MGAQLNPTSIALVAALDYPLATKMDVAENRAHTAVLPSVAYHGGGGYRTQDSLSAQRHTKQGPGGGVLFTYTLHPVIGLTTAHSGELLPLRRWRGLSWRGPAAAVPSEGKKVLTARHGGGGYSSRPKCSGLPSSYRQLTWPAPALPGP